MRCQEFLGVIERLVGGLGRSRPELSPVEVGHDVTPDPDGIDLVDGEVVPQTRYPGVHVRPAQSFVICVFAGRHLHQGGRAAEEHLGLLVHQDCVIAHTGHVGTARGGVAEKNQCDAGNTHRRQFGEVVEDLACVDEEFGLSRRSAPPDSTR